MDDSGLQRACALADIPDGGGREAIYRRDGRDLPVVLLRQTDRVFAYVNICPHQGRMLNFAPNRFMVRAGVLTCSHHGATFAVSDGACLGGPCRGAPLRRLNTIVQDGAVYLGEETTNDDRQGGP